MDVLIILWGILALIILTIIWSKFDENVKVFLYIFGIFVFIGAVATTAAHIAGYNKEIYYNKTYGTEYTADDIFYNGKLIDKKHQ